MKSWENDLPYLCVLKFPVCKRRAIASPTHKVKMRFKVKDVCKRSSKMVHSQDTFMQCLLVLAASIEMCVFICAPFLPTLSPPLFTSLPLPSTYSFPRKTVPITTDVYTNISNICAHKDVDSLLLSIHIHQHIYLIPSTCLFLYQLSICLSINQSIYHLSRQLSIIYYLR